MNVKMMAGVLVLALAGGCAKNTLTLLTDEQLRVEAHKVSVPQLPPRPPDTAPVEGAPRVCFQSYIIAMTASFDRQIGASKLVGKTVSSGEIEALALAVRISNFAIEYSAPNFTAVAGKTEEMDKTTTGSYVSGYKIMSGIIVPTFSEYTPDAVALRLKATLDGDAIVLENVEALYSSCFLVQCNATFGLAMARNAVTGEVPGVTLIWSEPVQEKHMAALKESVRLKPMEGVVFKLPGIIERGVSNLRVPLMNSSEINEKRWPGAGGTKERLTYYAIIMPYAITPAAPKTPTVAH